MGLYLSLTESMGGLKTQIFSFVQDQLNNRVNGWNFNCFKRRGGGANQVSGHSITKSCNVLLSNPKDCYKEVDE